MIECLRVLWIWSLPNSWFYRSVSALFFIVVLVSSPMFVQFFAFRSPTWFYVFSMLCLSLLDLFLVSSPSSVQLQHQSSLSDSTDMLANAKTSSCELQTLYLWCAPFYSRTTVHFTFLPVTIAVFGVLVGRQHCSFQCVGVPHYHWYHAHRLRISIDIYLDKLLQESGSALIKLWHIYWLASFAEGWRWFLNQQWCVMTTVWQILASGPRSVGPTHRYPDLWCVVTMWEILTSHVAGGPNPPLPRFSEHQLVQVLLSSVSRVSGLPIVRSSQRGRS